MKTFNSKTIRRSLAIAATLAMTAVGAFTMSAPAQARDSFSFGYSDGRSGFSVSDNRGYRNDRGDRDHWDRRDRDHDRGWRHHRYVPPAYYAPRYRYWPESYYYPQPRPYYYGY